LFSSIKEIIKSLLVILLILFFFSCKGLPSSKEIPFPVPETETPVPEAETPVPEAEVTAAPRTDYLTIVAAGDILLHEPIIKAAYVNGGYNFDSIYDNIRAYILPADIAFVNQETVLVNKELGYSGYPLFGSPKEAGNALIAAGFDIINHATNHIMDKGEAGILSSMDFWDSREGIHYLGIHRSEQDRAGRHIVINKNNFKIGFLSYTYGTNYIPLPKGKPYIVSIIEQAKMAAEIKALRPLCDYLVVSMHWGEEYRLNYNKEQDKYAAFLAEQQVDLVIGHHPHVLEPLMIIKRSDGGVMPVFYSLGNFISAQTLPLKEVLLGGLMYARLKKIEETISIEEIGLIPVVTHFDAGMSGFTIYPLHEYTEDLAAKHWKRRRGDSEMTAGYFFKKARDMFGTALIMENPFTR
jgi:poly-gamma-glutamate synthesis protein (capsule biosynthesis protein)